MRRRLALLLALAPGRALAHASERVIILTLPTGRYILGAATVVAPTALLGALAPRLPAFPSRRIATFPSPEAPAAGAASSPLPPSSPSAFSASATRSATSSP